MVNPSDESFSISHDWSEHTPRDHTWCQIASCTYTWVRAQSDCKAVNPQTLCQDLVVSPQAHAEGFLVICFPKWRFFFFYQFSKLSIMNLSKRIPYKWTKRKLHILKRLKKSNAWQHNRIYIQSVYFQFTWKYPLFLRASFIPQIEDWYGPISYRGQLNCTFFQKKKKSCLILAYDLTILPSSKTHTNVSWGKVILEYRWLKVDFICFQTGSHAWDSVCVPWWGSLFFLSFHPGLTSVLGLITTSHNFLSSIHLLYQITSSLRAGTCFSLSSL